eukprot:6440328-Lingulodinium_polyedra.AAC.1
MLHDDINAAREVARSLRDHPLKRAPDPAADPRYWGDYFAGGACQWKMLVRVSQAQWTRAYIAQ